jgi:hypothetical protein
MGTDELFKKRQATAILKRKEGQRGKVRDTVLIVTEGERTEPLYFEGFCLPNVTVVGSGCNCDSLVEFAKSVEIEYKRKRDMIFDKIWCVFDRDSFPLGNFDRAFFLANKYGYEVAYSNEAFELWYLLHFNYYDSQLSRMQYCNKLSELLGFRYLKNDYRMYNMLLGKQPQAMKWAERLLTIHKDNLPGNANPSTTVFKLVTYLNQWK